MLALATLSNILSYSDTLLLADTTNTESLGKAMPVLIEVLKSSHQKPQRLYAAAAIANASYHPRLVSIINQNGGACCPAVLWCASLRIVHSHYSCVQSPLLNWPRLRQLRVGVWYIAVALKPFHILFPICPHVRIPYCRPAAVPGPGAAEPGEPAHRGQQAGRVPADGGLPAQREEGGRPQDGRRQVQVGGFMTISAFVFVAEKWNIPKAVFSLCCNQQFNYATLVTL